MRHEHAYQVTVTAVGVAPNEDEEEIVSLRRLGTRPYESDNQVHVSVSVEMDLNRHRIVRWNYTLLDWLAVLGGLKEALTILFGAIFFVCQVNVFENFLVSQLFKGDDSISVFQRNKHDVDLSKFAAGKPLKYEKLTSLGQLKGYLRCIPSKSLALNLNEKRFQLAR